MALAGKTSEIVLMRGISMLKRIIPILSVFALLVPAIEPANAYPNQTKIAAQMACSGVSSYPVMNPEYYGQTRSGLDIWSCVETGSLARMYSMMNQGPYAVLVCAMTGCKVIDWTY
jgi:hypothetical protein